jgi:superfamily II DNA/RNA helicase
MRLTRARRTFQELFHGQLANELIEELRSVGVVSATQVQEKAIGVILSGKSAIVASPTGSGKTFAYVTPLIELLRREAAVLRPDRPTSLVVAPRFVFGKLCFLCLKI